MYYNVEFGQTKSIRRFPVKVFMAELRKINEQRIQIHFQKPSDQKKMVEYPFLCKKRKEGRKEKLDEKLHTLISRYEM